jgi:hypothetical protein
LEPIDPQPPCQKAPEGKGKSETPRAPGSPVRTASSPGQQAAAGKTTPQLRASELKARIDFAAVSSLLRAIAVLAIIYAILQMIAGWRAGAPRPNDAQVPARERRVVAALAVVGATAGYIYAYVEWQPNVVRDLLIRAPIEAAENVGLVSHGLLQKLDTMVNMNYLIAFVAAGLLLAYLAALTIDSEAAMPEADRLVGLQFVLAIGAAMFSAGVLASKLGIAVVKVVLDDANSRELIAALDRLPDVWALAYSGFLITAIGTAYFAMRGRDASINPQPAGGSAVPNSAFALRTPSGKDFKALGWVVNLVIAFAPVWLTEGLSKLIDAANKIQ